MYPSARHSGSTRRLGRPRSDEAQATRERILGAARRAFAANGYDATTNRHIADEVGITTGAIYHYFTSKSDLYVAVYAEVQELVYGTFEKAAAQHGTFVDRLSAALDAAVAVNAQDSSIASFVVGVAPEAQRHPELAPLVMPYRTRSRQFLTGLVEQAVANGEFAEGIEPLAVIDMANAVLSGLAQFSAVTQDPARHREATETVQKLLRSQLLG